MCEIAAARHLAAEHIGAAPAPATEVAGRCGRRFEQAAIRSVRDREIAARDRAVQPSAPRALLPPVVDELAAAIAMA